VEWQGLAGFVTPVSVKSNEVDEEEKCTERAVQAESREMQVSYKQREWREAERAAQKAPYFFPLAEKENILSSFNFFEFWPLFLTNESQAKESLLIELGLRLNELVSCSESFNSQILLITLEIDLKI
jgi:hypothetical protein